MTAIAWDDKLRIALIKAVQGKRYIWNCSDKDYKNKTMKESAWEEIAGKLSQLAPVEISAEEAMKQWKNLRDHYVKQKKNQPTTGNGIRSTQWRYFKFMTFLDEHFKRRSTLFKPPASKHGRGDALLEPHMAETRKDDLMDDCTAFGANVAEQLRILKQSDVRLFAQGKRRINEVLADLELEMIEAKMK